MVDWKFIGGITALGGLIGFFGAKTIDTKKLPAGEKAVLTGASTGATMEGLDLALGAEEYHMSKDYLNPQLLGISNKTKEGKEIVIKRMAKYINQSNLSDGDKKTALHKLRGIPKQTKAGKASSIKTITNLLSWDAESFSANEKPICKCGNYCEGDPRFLEQECLDCEKISHQHCGDGRKAYVNCAFCKSFNVRPTNLDEWRKSKGLEPLNIDFSQKSAESFAADGSGKSLRPSKKIPEKKVVVIDGEEYTIQIDDLYGYGWDGSQLSYQQYKKIMSYDLKIPIQSKNGDGKGNWLIGEKRKGIEDWLKRKFNPKEIYFDDDGDYSEGARDDGMVEKTGNIHTIWFSLNDKVLKFFGFEIPSKKDCSKGHTWSNAYIRNDYGLEDDGTASVEYGQRCEVCDVERRGSIGGKVYWDKNAESFAAEGEHSWWSANDYLNGSWYICSKCGAEKAGGRKRKPNKAGCVGRKNAAESFSANPQGRPRCSKCEYRYGMKTCGACGDIQCERCFGSSGWCKSCPPKCAWCNTPAHSCSNCSEPNYLCVDCCGELNAESHDFSQKSAESLKKDSCCCGATKSNPCACMIQGVMKCSATCPCSLEKKAESIQFNAWTDPISDRQKWLIEQKGGKHSNDWTRGEANKYIKKLLVAKPKAKPKPKASFRNPLSIMPTTLVDDVGVIFNKNNDEVIGAVAYVPQGTCLLLTGDAQEGIKQSSLKMIDPSISNLWFAWKQEPHITFVDNRIIVGVEDIINYNIRPYDIKGCAQYKRINIPSKPTTKDDTYKTIGEIRKLKENIKLGNWMFNIKTLKQGISKLPAKETFESYFNPKGLWVLEGADWTLYIWGVKK